MFEIMPINPDWLVALGSILLLDLLLSGDNAIIIALACKDLPTEQRKKAIFWGCAGAIGLRVSLTLMAAWLLEIPYLQFAGGVALLWIAVKLLAKDPKVVHVDNFSSLGAAVKTILFADLIMSLDNVLSLAAVAQTVPESKYSLLIIGLLASIPLVIWGSQLFLKIMDKYPVIIYIGAGILGYASAEMVIADKITGPVLDQYSIFIQITFVVFVLALGHFLKIRHRNAQINPSEN